MPEAGEESDDFSSGGARRCRHLSVIRAPISPPHDRRPLAVGGFAAIVLVGFLIAPGNVAWKTHVALHGLCAQRASHSLQIGGATLPMDARMTGIYLGAAATFIWLVAARRLRATRVPAVPVLSLLASFVVALAVDGFNALLVDLRLPTIYEPSNILRLATGVLAGTSLGVVLGHLFASSMWARGDPERAVVTRPVEVFAPIGISIAIAMLMLSDFPSCTRLLLLVSWSRRLASFGYWQSSSWRS